MKEIISAIAVILTLFAYVPYYRDILKGKTHPHAYSWSLWALLTILIIILQVKGGAGAWTSARTSARMGAAGVAIIGGWLSSATRAWKLRLFILEWLLGTLFTHEGFVGSTSLLLAKPSLFLSKIWHNIINCKISWRATFAGWQLRNV